MLIYKVAMHKGDSKLRARLGRHEVKGRLSATGAISNKCALRTIDYANLMITIKSNYHAQKFSDLPVI